mmetsp:Transcript_5033/g.13555  ORF Transcript_5033/g.13555 Transcript_5033/m.13555 type:complete len:92 (-) Transcript_5033:1192-1467(-)
MATTGYSPFLVFETDDLDDKIPRLLRLGAVLDGPIAYKPYARIASLRAPCGQMIALSEKNDVVGDRVDDVAASMAGKVRLQEMQRQEDDAV